MPFLPFRLFFLVLPLFVVTLYAIPIKTGCLLLGVNVKTILHHNTLTFRSQACSLVQLWFCRDTCRRSDEDGFLSVGVFDLSVVSLCEDGHDG